MLMPGRHYNADKYRFGFNGKEHDTEWKGSAGSIYDYGFRIYDPRIAKFLSVDPLTATYPWYTPYQFAGNSPIYNIDLDGLEELDFRILEKIQQNVTKWNVNMNLAPKKFKGEKTKARFGRKWNARWCYNEILEMDPSFWSKPNQKKILAGELPTVDDHYLKKNRRRSFRGRFCRIKEGCSFEIKDTTSPYAS